MCGWTRGHRRALGPTRRTPCASPPSVTSTARRPPQGELQRLASPRPRPRADVVLLCGDLTDYGPPDEARVLGAELRRRPCPWWPCSATTTSSPARWRRSRRSSTRPACTVLDGEAWEREGVGFAGAKGFGGGFGERALAPWGEPAMKHFVQEAIDGGAEARVGPGPAPHAPRVALLHYAPIAARWRASRSRSSRSWARAASRSRSTAIPSTRSSTATPTAGRPRGAPRAGVPVYNVACPSCATVRRIWASSSSTSRRWTPRAGGMSR